MIAILSSGGTSLLQKQDVYKTVTKEQQLFWKRILIVDDDNDITTTFKEGIEDSNNRANKRIEVHTSNNPGAALSEFKPNFYDLLLVDINMPRMNGFELCEKIFAIDINVRICFMSSGEINREALREIEEHHGICDQDMNKPKLNQIIITITALILQGIFLQVT